MLEIGEQGVRFRSYVDGSERFMGPEESMEVQAALGSDIALAFDECTPYHADRDYTARSMERTHRWLDRCLAWHERQGPRRQAVFGIVQGGVHEDLRRAAAERVSAAAVDGLAIGGTLGRDKEEMRGVIGMTVPHLDRDAPVTCSGSASPTIWWRGSGSAWICSTAPCPLASPGMEWLLRRCRRSGFASTSAEPSSPPTRRPLVEGCPCAACAAHSRAYVHFLSRAEELTGVRLLVLHNLTYLERLVRGRARGNPGGALRRLQAGRSQRGCALAGGGATPSGDLTTLTACGS